MITQVARTDGLALRAAVLGPLDLKRLLAQEDECDELTYTSNKTNPASTVSVIVNKY